MDSDSSLLYESCTPSASDVNLGEEVTSRLAPLENCFEEFEESPYRIESQVDDFDQNPGGPLSIETHASDPIHEDFEVMGIENTWTDDDAFTGPPPPVEVYNGAIPLPPPPRSERDGVLPPVVQFDETDFPRTCTDIDPHQELEALFSSPTNTPIDIGLDDIKDTSACPGVCGIRNLGNTCFMSAGLQCLGATPSLVQCFTNQKYFPPICSSLSAPISSKLSSSTQAVSPTSSLSSEYADLLTKMWSGRYTVLNPTEFKQALGITHPQFKDFRQHDCQEFLALLLDTLHEELNTATAKKAAAFSGNFSISSPPLSCVSATQCPISSLSSPSNNLSNGTVDTKVPGWPKPFVWKGLSRISKDLESNLNCKPWSPFSEEDKSSCSLEKMELSVNETSRKESDDSKEEDKKAEEEVKQTKIEAVDSEELPEEQPLATPTFIRNETNASCGEEAGCSWNLSSPCSSNARRIEKNEVQAQQMSMEAKKLSDGIGQLRRTLPFPGALPIPSRGTVGIEDIMKEAKTSNVNVLASDSSTNGGIKFDSDKFVRRVRRGECHGVVQGITSPEDDLSHSLAVIHDCDVQDGVAGEVLAGKTKRVKDTNIVLRGVGGISPLPETKQDVDSEMIITTAPKPPNECFNNVKRMRLASVKTQSYAKANGILGKNIGLIGNASSVIGKNMDVMHVDDGIDNCEGISESLTLTNKVSSMKYSDDPLRGDKVPSPTECVADKIGSLNGLGDFSRTVKEGSRVLVNEVQGNEEEEDFGHAGENVLEEESEADRHWQKHIAANRSTIVDTFQGQFKSTVVCSACKHVSVTYEPFMYLSVPLPHAMERQICVTFVPAEAKPPVRYLLTLNKQGKVSEMRQQLYKILAEESKFNSPALEQSFAQDSKPDIALAEVLDNHIAKILDDNYLLRYVNNTNRSIYAFELRPPPLAFGVSPPGSISSTSKESHTSNGVRPTSEPLDLTNLKQECLQGPSKEAVEGSEEKKKESPAGPFGSDGWRSCAICLEEMDTDLRVHSACSCVLCESCIETSCRHYGGDSLACPVCGQVVDPKEEFIPLDKVGDSQPPAVRILQVPLVFRVDEEGDGNNNRKTMKLWGHPALLRLPSRIQAKDLYDAVERLLPPCVLFSDNNASNSASPSTSSSQHQEEDTNSSKYQLLLVDGQGYHCSRCMYTVHCRGCHISSLSHAEIALQAGDTLAVRVYAKDLSVDACGDGTLPLFEREVMEHRSMRDRWKEEPLSLYDCLQAFSESEMLDEHNPWFCPVCQLNQCATKTLSVWRYPDFLIVYLKRFVFHECVSTKLDDKVTFPLCGLHVAPPTPHQSFTQSSNHCNQVQRHHRGSPHPYNLYAAVCHFGGASAGHYTAYSKHPGTSEWHYFNDEAVSRQKPREEDYSNAYILFYHKQGLSFDLLSMPKKISTEVDEEEDEEEEEETAKDLKPNIEQLILDLDSSVEQDWRKEQIVDHTAMVMPVAEAMEGIPF